MRALGRDREQRFGSAREMADALERMTRGVGRPGAGALQYLFQVRARMWKNRTQPR